MKVKDALNKVRIMNETIDNLSKLETLFNDDPSKAEDMADKVNMSISIDRALTQAIVLISEMKKGLETRINDAEISNDF